MRVRTPRCSSSDSPTASSVRSGGRSWRSRSRTASCGPAAARPRTARAVGTILVSGLEALGVHGVLPEEQARAQPFGVDLELEVDLGPAGTSDDLADTIDYAAVIAVTVRIVETERYSCPNGPRPRPPPRGGQAGR